MRSSNPVLGGFARRLAGDRSGPGPQAAPGHGQPQGYPPGYPTEAYGGQQWAPPVEDRMTVDDVVVRTVGLLAVLGVTAALSWLLIPTGTVLEGIALFGALGVGLVLGLVIAFARVTNPAVIIPYAAIEGVLLGLVSRYFETFFPGIVIQAVAATFGVFLGMALLYKARVLRATRTFTKVVIGALIGLVALMFVNFGLTLFGVGYEGQGLGLREYSATGDVQWWAILFSIACIVVAALTFILDFDAVEEGVRVGAERKYAWYASFGILVGLIWLYLEILRLISYFRR